MAEAGSARWDWAAVRTVVVGQEVLAVRLLSCRRGVSAVDLIQARTGQEIADVPFWYDKCYIDPDAYLSTFATADGAYAMVREHGYRYFVLRVSPSGVENLGTFPTGPVQGVHAIAPALLAGRPAVLTTDWKQVRYRDLRTGVELAPSWTPPSGWQIDDLVRAGGRTYAYLEPIPPPGPISPSTTDWRYWLWDAVAREPVGAPAYLRGSRSGAAALAGRPAQLVRVDWDRYRMWDLARRAPAGPELPADLPAGLVAVSYGSVHGRPVVAGGIGSEVRLWDVGTGDLVQTAVLDRPPIASCIGPGAYLYIVDSEGALIEVPVPARAVHPVARRAAATP